VGTHDEEKVGEEGNDGPCLDPALLVTRIKFSSDKKPSNLAIVLIGL